MPLSEGSTEHVVFGGDCDLTPARYLDEKIDGRTIIRRRPEEVQSRLAGVDYDAFRLEPGEGRVTKASRFARDSLAPDAAQPGLFPVAFAVCICGSYADRPSDLTFRDGLRNILLYWVGRPCRRCSPDGTRPRQTRSSR